MRLSRGKLNDPRPDLKTHFLKSGEHNRPACGQTVTSFPPRKNAPWPVQGA